VRAAAALAAGVAAAAAAVLVPTLAGRGGGPHPRTAVSASAAIAPRAHLFGDRVHARVRVALDPRRVDARSVAIETSFAPYSVVERRVERSSATVLLDLQLLCLTRACAPLAPQRRLSFPPARVRFRAGGRERTVSVEWPPLLVASRLSPADLKQPALHERNAAQPLSTRVDPDALGWGLAAGAGLLVLLAGARAALRLRPPSAVAEGVRPERLPALRRALANVERLAGESDEIRRSALDRLARELEEAGLARLAPQARTLAWSEQVPSAEPMRRLTEEVQQAVEESAA
jgi:hypothetical protein